MTLKRVASLLLAFLFYAPLASAKTYHIPTTVWSYSPPQYPWVGPQFLFGNGYIKTDGTLGELAAENIVDFDIKVVGQYPFHFTLQTARLGDLRGVFASDSDLFLAGEPFTTHLGFEGELPGFSGINEYYPSETLAVSWHVVSDSLAALAIYGQPGALLSTSVEGKVPYGIASIPEPTAALLAVIALNVMLLKRPYGRTQSWHDANGD
ncbi:MAG: hypothetical protein AAGA92_05800 [Planctomycetota bacterium]